MNETLIEKLYMDRRARYAERDKRMQRVRDALKGDMTANLKRLGARGNEPAVGNLILSTVRTISQRVGKMPRLYATSSLDSPTAKKRAEKHEAALAQRLQAMHFWNLLPQAAYWLASSGFLPVMLTHDKDLGHSRIRLRDPLTCYPSTVWPHEPGVKDCLFVYRMSPSEIMALFPDSPIDLEYNGQCTIAEYVCDEGTYIYITEPQVLLLSFLPNENEMANVWVARDLTPDFDFYGQFDQVVPIMEAEARITALMEAYAEQQVTAETWVIGEITSNEGNVAHGLGAVNTLEPAPSASVQKLTNNMSPQVFQQLSFYERQQRLTGSIPAQLGGEPEVSYATGRGIEKLTVAVDDNVGHYQNILAITLQEVFDRIPRYEASCGVPNPGFAPDVTVFPHFKVGADPAMDVSLLQKVGAKTMARRSAMDQDVLIEDPAKEEEKIEVEALREALLSSLLKSASDGSGDNMALIHLIQQREEGMSLEDALQEYYQSLQQQAPPMGGGPPPAIPGGGGGPPPSLEALLGGGAAGPPGSLPPGGPAGPTPAGGAPVVAA